MTCNHTPGMWCVHLNSLIFLVVDILPHVVNIILQRCFSWPCTYYGMYLWPSSHIFITTLLVPRWVIVVNNIPPKNSCCAAIYTNEVLCWPLGTLCHYVICSETKQCGFLPLCWGCGDTTAACIMCSGLATQSSTLHSNASSSLQDVTPIHTPTYVWSSNTCYWYLVRQKKQRSSNRITYRIAGNFRGRTFHKLVERRSC